MSRITLLLVDDHTLFRESLERMLSSEPDFSVLGRCSDAAEALRLLQQSAVDIVLLDFNLQQTSGAHLITLARESGYAGSFLMVTAGMEVRDIVQSLRLGVSGICLKHNSVESLVRAIRLVASGDIWLDRKVVQLLANRAAHIEEPGFRQSLTEREDQVLAGIVEGLSNRTIAQTLAISEGAVKSTLQQLFDKTGVRSRAQLVVIALHGSHEKPGPSRS